MNRHVRRPFLACAVVGFALVAISAAYQARPLIALDFGAAGTEKFLDNFHAPERGYRWSQSTSAVWLSGLGGGNLRWNVSVRLSGSRPTGVASPHVRISVNGRLLDEFTAPGEERDHVYALPEGALGANGDLLLQIDSDTFTTPNDSRALGVRVLRVEATPVEGFALPAAKTIGLLLGIVAAGAAGAWAIGTPEARRESTGTTAAASSAGRTGMRAAARAVAWPVMVASIGAMAIAFNRAEGAWWLAVVGFGASAAATLLVAVRLIAPRAAFSRRQWKICLVIFGGAALARLLLDSGRGYEGDVALYLAWVWKTVTFGIQSAYLPITEVPPTDNPPALLYPLWLMGWFYRQVFSPLFPPPWLNDPPILRFMLRLPALSADLLTAAIIARVTAARGARTTLTTMAIYLFNPALIFDGAYWGQTAALHSLWMLGAVVAASRPAFAWAGAAITLAVLTKPQALATAPLMLLAAWRGRRLARFAGAGAATAAIVALPFALAGNLASVVRQYTQTAQYHPVVSANAHNLWWLVTAGQGWQPDNPPEMGMFSFRSAGIVLFGLATILSLLVVWRTEPSGAAREGMSHVAYAGGAGREPAPGHGWSALYAAAAFQSFAFFMLLTQIHENHLVPMFAPLAVACALERKNWWLFGALAITALANMALHDPNLVMALGYPADEIYGGPRLAWPRWLNASAQTGLFVIFAAQMIERLRRRAPLASISDA